MNKAALDAIKLLFKNWWKLVLIILVAGLMISGFAFKIGPFACDKQGIKYQDVTPEKK